MVRIKTQLAARQNYGGRRTQKIDWIVMHYTANDGDCDEANGRYFQQVLDPVASAHYFVDDDSITRSVPDEFVAYHCGAQAYRHPSCRNSNSIGVELCDSRRDGQVMATEQTLENAAELVHWLCRQYDVPYSHILQHYDVTGKLCPAYWVGNDGLERFRKRVEEADEVVEQSKMIVDGKTVPVARILKNGTNYVKIRDVAAALGLEVGFTGNIAVLRSPKKE